VQKCPKCGKKFETLQALNDHFRAIHPNQRFVAPKPNTSRNLVLGLVIVIVIVGGLVGALIYTQKGPSTTTTATGLLESPISFSLYQDLTQVSFSTLASIGNGGSGVSPPTSIASSPLLNGTKPEILYIGAEFCPYCAAERWSLVIALSKFGNFSNLGYMQSAPDDGNIATLTFLHSNYVSQYLSFVTVENEDRQHNALQIPTSSEQALWNQFNQNSYPFIDIGGKYDVTTSQFSYGDLTNMNWTQIGSQLSNVSSPTAKVIDGSANILIKAICSITANLPSSVCNQQYLTNVNVSYVMPSSSTLSQGFQSTVQTFQPATMKLGKPAF